jgi:hypothetical protein
MSDKERTERRHRFHAICPYFAMFPETFVADWIGRLCRKDDTVLDPFCGRGTAPFQALLMGRSAIGCDINPVAFCITRAKTNAPSVSAVHRRITLLENGYRSHEWEGRRRKLPPFFHKAYAPETLRQVLYLREALTWRQSRSDCMVAAIALGALHGESNKSPSYLSNQMPRTISTKPNYSVRFWEKHGYTAPHRDAFDLLRKRTDYRYESSPPESSANVFNADMRELPRLLRDSRTPIRCAITSPPYLDVTSFEEDQWLRLWFLGGPPRPTYRQVSRDDRYEDLASYWGMIADLWRVLGCVLCPRADVVIRIGGKGVTPEQLVNGLVATSAFSKREALLAYHEVSSIKRRQTDSFRPGSKGCSFEVDCHFQLQ